MCDNCVCVCVCERVSDSNQSSKYTQSLVVREEGMRVNLIFGATVPLQAFANWKEMTEILTKRVHLTSNSWAYINKHYNPDHAEEKKNTQGFQ